MTQDNKPTKLYVPDGWRLVPKELTAENCAKAALIGEFFVEQEINCPECDADEHDVGACSMCHGEGFVRNKISVPWTTIKNIWRRTIEHFDVVPQPPVSVMNKSELVQEMVDLLKDIRAMGYFVPAFDSSINHREICKKANNILIKLSNG